MGWQECKTCGGSVVGRGVWRPRRGWSAGLRPEDNRPRQMGAGPRLAAGMTDRARWGRRAAAEVASDAARKDAIEPEAPAPDQRAMRAWPGGNTPPQRSPSASDPL